MFALVSFCLSSSFYFQHIMGLAPCIMCIYERMMIIGLWILSVTGFMFHQSKSVRPFIMASWFMMSLAGLHITYKHYSLQTNPPLFGFCSTKLSFSDYLPLDSWFPSVFKAYGSCVESVWAFGGLSMVQWILVVFLLNLVLASVFCCVDYVAASRREGVYRD